MIRGCWWSKLLYGYDVGVAALLQIARRRHEDIAFRV